MSSGKSLWILTAGTTGALILTYCIYYDMKRRTDPEYKRKVHERRLQSKVNKLRHFDDDNEDDAVSGLEDFDINDLVIQFSSVNMFNTIERSDQFSTEANLTEGFSYLANAILLCTPDPEPMLQKLSASLPKTLMMPLSHQLSEVQIVDNDDSNSVRSETSPIQLQQF